MSRVGPAPVELNTDCTTCGLEAGVVEVYDAMVPACRFGVPATARCKLCGEQLDATFDREPARPMREVPANRCPACLGELAPEALDHRRCAACGATASVTCVAPPASLDGELALGAALDAWAHREGWPSREALLDATFCEPSVAALLARLAKKEPLEVVADPFANMGVRTTGGKGARGKKDEGARGKKDEDVRAKTDETKAPTNEERRSKEPTAPVVTVTPDRVTVNPPSNPLKIKTPTQDFRADITAPDPLGAFTTAPTDPLAPPLAAKSPPAAPAPPPPAQILATGAATPFAPAQALATGAATPFSPANASASAGAPAPPPVTADAPRSAPPRAIVYPLVSVVAADGEVHPAERALVDRFLQSEGLPPLTDDEFCVHHPSAVAHLVPKERREAVIQLMCETATVDGMPDESERRVIRAYATAWDVPDEKVEFWMWGYESMSTSLVRQLWMKLRRFVLSARWSDTGKD